MNPILIDTSGWAALMLRPENGHATAVMLYQQWRRDARRLLTTNYVLAELLSLFIGHLRVPREEQFRHIDFIRTSPLVEVVHVDKRLDDAAWAFLKARADKDWSLVDSVSFLVMQERGITEALTSDHHFDQAGFTRLLRT